MRRLKKFGLIMAVILCCSFGVIIATYPAEIQIAFSDSWETARSLAERIANLGRKTGIIERLTNVVTEDETKEHSYLATLPHELAEKIKVSYNYQKVYSAEWDEIQEEYKPKVLTDIRYGGWIKNLSNQTIVKIQYEVIIKDVNGNILTSSEEEIWTDTLPGQKCSITGEIWIKDALEKAGISAAEDPTLKIEMVVISVKFD